MVSNKVSTREALLNPKTCTTTTTASCIDQSTETTTREAACSATISAVTGKESSRVDVATKGCLPQAVGAWTISGISRMLLVTSEHLAGTTQASVLVTVETRKWVGKETDTPREIETEAGIVTHPAQEIATGTVAATEKESTRNLIMSTSRF